MRDAVSAFPHPGIAARTWVSLVRHVSRAMTAPPRIALRAVAVAVAVGPQMVLRNALDQSRQVQGDGVAWVLRVPAVQMLPPVLLP